MTISIHIFFLILLSFLVLSCSDESISQQGLHAKELSSSREPVLWELKEWTVQNASYSDNPFDVVATVTFEHQGSGKTHETEMFYDGDDTWKYRFTGTRTGTWTYTTVSDDPELDGHSGMINVLENPDPEARGFVTMQGNKWARQVSDGTLEPFVPHFRMTFDERNPLSRYSNSFISDQLDPRMGNEGFNGIFIFVAAKWADATITSSRWTDVSNTDPDPVSFEALERLIQEVHARGGILHIWYVGDCSRNQCIQAGFGNNGASTEGEKRLLRYIGARLGPIPGWVMGYGYDNNEHVNTNELQNWGSFLRDHLGWPHPLGARDQGQNINYSFWPEADFYSRGNWFNGASYSDIRSVLESDTNKSHSFDERWWKSRLHSEENIIRQLWALNMAGGASATFGWGDSFFGWGDSFKVGLYPHPEWFKTFFVFWKERFLNSMTSDNSLTDNYTLKDDSNEHFVFYKEATSSIRIDLSEALGSLKAVAVDTRASYREIELGTLDPERFTWDAPYTSDWAIAVGNF